MPNNKSRSKKADGAKLQMPSEKAKLEIKEVDNIEIASDKTGVHIKPQ